MLTITIAPSSDKTDGQLLRCADAQLVEICQLAIALGCNSVQVRSGELMPPPFNPVQVLQLTRQLNQVFAEMN